MENNTYNEKAVAIARYLAHKPAGGTAQCLGFELEHFVVEKESLAFVPYLSDPLTGKPGIEEILKRIAPFYDERVYEHDKDNLMALSRKNTAITLEPGAQLEISIGPLKCISEIEAIYRRFREEIEPILDEMGYTMVESGYHPSACAHEIPLIPKDRYHHMDAYFKQTGKHGICMMRGTAASQVSIDFVDEYDAVRKLRIAHVLGPLFAFITDNTCVYEGVTLGDDSLATSPGSGFSIPRRMARMVNWDDCDPYRCLTPSILFDEDFGFESYAKALLAAPAIFTVAETGRSTVYQGFTPFDQAISLAEIDEKTIEHILALFFFDARFKQYVEIRQADSLPLEYGLAFVALVKGIFYNDKALDYYEDRFQYLDPASIAFAKTALRKSGYAATVYQRVASEWLDELIDFAIEGLPQSEHHYLQPLAQLVEERTTLVDQGRR